MNVAYKVTGWLAAVAVVVGLFACSASATTTYSHYRVTAVDAAGSQYGWKHAECGKNMGGTKSSVKAGLSVYYTPCKGSPGPRPIGSYYLQCDMEGSTVSSTYPGQAWLGTDRYSGVKLNDITALKYWAMLDYRGCDYSPLSGSAPNEFKIDWLSSQPPQMTLYAKDANNNWIVLVYRPWSKVGTGTEQDPEYKGLGPTDGSMARMWKEYDCLTEGYWLEINNSGQYIDTWDDVLFFFGTYALATPPLSTTTVGYPDKFPTVTKDVSGWFLYASNEAPIRTSVNLILGARADNNPTFPMGWRGWYMESWNAQGAVDLVTFGYVNPQLNQIVEDFDFQHPTYVPDPVNNKVRAINNKAIVDAVSYAPLPRDRTWVTPPDQPADWWGRPNPAVTTIDATKMTAMQRVGNFNYTVPKGTTTYSGALFALYGLVSDVVVSAHGDYLFNVNDGAGIPIACYCPKAGSPPVTNGQYVRMVGTVYGQDPYEWYYNWLHCVKWNSNPALREYSHLWPWRFDTYAWNVTVLN